jgi:hypothetical protein
VRRVSRRLFIQKAAAAVPGAFALANLSPRRLLAQGMDSGAGAAHACNSIPAEEFARYFERGKRMVPLRDRSISREGHFSFRTDGVRVTRDRPYILVRSKDGSFRARIAEEGNPRYMKEIDFGFVPSEHGGTLEFRVYGDEDRRVVKHRITFNAGEGRHVHKTLEATDGGSEYEMAMGQGVVGVKEGSCLEEEAWNRRIRNYAGRAIGGGGAEFGNYIVEFVTKEDAVAFSFMDSCESPPPACWEFEGGEVPEIPGRIVKAEAGKRRYAILGKTIGELEPEVGIWVVRPENLKGFSKKKCAILADPQYVLVYHDSGKGYGLTIVGRERVPVSCSGIYGDGARKGKGGKENPWKDDMGYLVEEGELKIVVPGPGVERGASVVSVYWNGKTNSDWAIVE